MPKLLAVYLLPPAALARLGGSHRPLENYEWRTDPTVHGGALTVIEPATTLDVAEDGSVTPYLPGTVRFRDGNELRPVAPFFEIWARLVFTDEDRKTGLAGPEVEIDVPLELPLTATLLRAAGGSLAGVSYTVSVANRKAARRTGDDANVFQATLRVRGDDHARHPLLASTPPRPGQEPLVTSEHPIPLGVFQVMRPARRAEVGVDLDVLRARFTPARGQVYGPPSAVEAVGTTLAALFTIVPQENRILNPRSTWLTYDADYSRFDNPEPSDTYDGADQDRNVSWGVVDDTCDGVVSVTIVVRGVAYRARARVFVGPPDYAPDRRPFLSLADDLADRDEEPVAAEDLATPAGRELVLQEVADLFARAFETASLLNLDAIRLRAIGDNQGVVPEGDPSLDKPPFVDDRSFTSADVGYASARVASVVTDAPPSLPQFTPLVPLAHESLALREGLLAFLRSDPARVKRMIRPPYAAFSELSRAALPTDRRDPRSPRDTAHDMRMPPYMRDEMARALSLTRRQYLDILGLVDVLASVAGPAAASPALTAAAPGGDHRSTSPVLTDEHSEVRRRVRAALARRRPSGASR